MMNTNASKTANVLGGKTVKACDSCLRKRARWFCAADDAFLCQSCDNKVHSANQLASRHERVRIGTSSSKTIDMNCDESAAPAWHHGFTRKARTPRYGKQTVHKKESYAMFNPFPLVPEIGSDETTLEENEEQLLFRVPVFDPSDAELCSVPTDMDCLQGTAGDEIIIGNELEALLYNHDGTCDLEIPELLGSEMELAGFAADVESLLGTGLDEVIDPYGDDQEGNILDIFFERSKVKMEDDNEVKNVIACHLDPALDSAQGESLNWDFDYDMGEHQEQKIAYQVTKTSSSNSGNQVGVGCKRKRLLILNHEAVITAWNNQGSPWADGVRPKFNPDDCWSDILGAYGGEHTYGTFGVKGRDGGREARVTRYREKRRTRLYSRKIRYEVRKLNAEKRPRMKGRFVKRTDIAGTSNLPPYMINSSS
ncbi:hypothetical protein Leryth_006125 [Lithospermum erythrorhizon]|uniref:Uncharacterized protein n=1 Tax=Lithospermum erythrorhizon TaxID=34254 RepID=A0AAV3RSD6_LITER|nr:hypothetical protein Leryth_006125 [Lithospermum erythrorhizon]